MIAFLVKLAIRDLTETFSSLNITPRGTDLQRRRIGQYHAFAQKRVMEPGNIHVKKLNTHLLC
jgi:hypothetical protein